MFPVLYRAVSMFRVESLVSFPGPVLPGTTYPSFSNQIGERGVVREGRLPKGVIVRGSDYVFQQGLLFRVDVCAERFDVFSWCVLWIRLLRCHLVYFPVSVGPLNVCRFAVEDFA